jgi:hypothetical protein
MPPSLSSISSSVTFVFHRIRLPSDSRFPDGLEERAEYGERRAGQADHSQIANDSRQSRRRDYRYAGMDWGRPPTRIFIAPVRQQGTGRPHAAGKTRWRTGTGVRSGRRRRKTQRLELSARRFARRPYFIAEAFASAPSIGL